MRLRGDDHMRFSATRIEVQAGRTIAVELANEGTQPRDAMGHNLVVLRPGSDVTALAAKALDARSTGYVPADAPEILAHTRLLGPGERQLLRFEVPGPGTYPFLCSFPGHVGLMNGELVVR